MARDHPSHDIELTKMRLIAAFGLKEGKRITVVKELKMARL